MDLTEFTEHKLKASIDKLVESMKLRHKVIADISDILKVTNSMPLSNMDYWERYIRNYYESNCSINKHKNLFSFLGKEKSRYPLNWLDLISYDGYKREKTIRSIIGPVPNKFLLVLLFRRLNDWVKEVRIAAVDKIPSLVAQSKKSDISESLIYVLIHWNSWSRVGKSEQSIVINALTNENIFNELKDKIISSSSGPMCLILTYLARTPLKDKALLDIATKSIQPTVRAKAIRFLFEKRVYWVIDRKKVWSSLAFSHRKIKPIVEERSLIMNHPFEKILNIASSDRSSIVRRVAAEFLIKNLDQLGGLAIDYAIKFAADNSLAVSERGNFALRKLDFNEQ